MKKRTAICMTMATLLMTTPVWASSPVVAVGNHTDNQTFNQTSSTVGQSIVQINQSPAQSSAAQTQGQAVTLPLLDESRPVVSETFVPEKFVLPQDASVLVVVEGRGGTD